jgi:hypothetical protein
VTGAMGFGRTRSILGADPVPWAKAAKSFSFNSELEILVRIAVWIPVMPEL